MTADALLVVHMIFSMVWQLFNSWYIPGTNVTPAAFAFFLWLLAWVCVLLNILALLGEVVPMAPDVSAFPSAAPSAGDDLVLASPELSAAPEASSGPLPVLDPELELAGREADEIVVYALDPITADDTSGLKSVLLSVLGPYENIVTEYRYMNNNQSYYSYLREITPDYPWFGSLAVFLVLLFSVFRIGGSLLWKK